MGRLAVGSSLPPKVPAAPAVAQSHCGSDAAVGASPAQHGPFMKDHVDKQGCG